MEMIAKVMRRLEELQREIALVRKVLVRFGTVHTVAERTVVVEWAGDDASGSKARSLPMPWLQRSTESRAPSVGDHAVVFDPSLGNGAAVALIGWPSAARPAPIGGGHVLYSGADTAKIAAPSVELGQAPTDMAALASKVDAELARIWDALTDPTIAPVVPTGSDGGEVGLATLIATVAPAGKAARQSVAADQVKIK